MKAATYLYLSIKLNALFTVAISCVLLWELASIIVATCATFDVLCYVPLLLLLQISVQKPPKECRHNTKLQEFNYLTIQDFDRLFLNRCKVP